MRGRGVGRNVVVATVGNLFAPLAALATAPIMAHGLGTSGRGDVAAATAPLLLAATVATFGLPVAVTYWVARHPGLLGPLLRRAGVLLVAAGLLTSGLIVVGSPSLAGGRDEVARLISLAAAVVGPTLIVTLLQAAAAGAHRWRLVAAERFLTAFVRLAAFIGLAATHRLDVTASVVVLALSPLCGGVVYFALLRRGADPGSAESAGLDSRAFVGYGLRVWIGSITGILLSRVDQTLMLPLSNPTELGLYAVAVTVGDLPLVVVGAVRDVLFSAEASRNSTERLARVARLSTTVALLIATVVGVPAVWWVPAVFGPEFGDAVPACLILLAAVVVGNPGSLAGVGLSARGRPGLRSTALAIACLSNVALLVATVPTLGATGAAFATLAGNLVAGGICLLLFSRATEEPWWTLVGLRRADLRAVRDVVAHRLARRD